MTLEFSARSKLRLLKMYQNIDISLDTFPYPGVTTSFESIWMGVPVITMMGKNFVSRCGESINLNLGLKNFIAKDEKDYVTKAVSLNTNKDELAKIRLNLRTKALESPLFDTDSFNLQFSNMIKEIWSNYLK